MQSKSKDNISREPHEGATPFKTLDPLTDFTNAIVDKMEDIIIYEFLFFIYFFLDVI